MRILPRLACGFCLTGLLSAQVPSDGPQAPKASVAGAVQEADPASDLGPQLRRFVEVLNTVETQGADREPLDKLIYEGAIPSMLRQLDPHTQFFEPSQFEQLRQMEQAEQKGFGSIVSVLPGQVIFLQIFPGTPVSKAGIQAGDELVAINDVAIASLEPDQIIELLTEARQERITASIRREGDAKVLTFHLTPELVDSPSVDRAFLLEPGVGYIRVASWDLQTTRQLRDALGKLKAESLRELVIDLRDNPGGIVKAALDAAAMFLKPGQRILTAKGRAGVVETADVPANAKPYPFKLAVLVNGKTASASEILAGALQDHDRAVVVGEPSYGKGLVQSVMPLSQGAGIALTTAFYYTPSGRSIQKPLRNSALSLMFDNRKESLPVYKTDNARTVTGGGGIQPDIEIAREVRNKLETVLDASGAVTAFATRYLANHSPLADSFGITPEIVDEFKVFLAQRNIQPAVGEWADERAWISNRLMEEILTQARGVDKGDEVAARRDPQVQTALKAMRDGSILASAGK